VVVGAELFRSREEHVERASYRVLAGLDRLARGVLHTFDPAARVTLFADLAEHFKAVVTFPPEIVESMPDEQYVRNVVDILFRTRVVEAKPAAQTTVAIAG